MASNPSGEAAGNVASTADTSNPHPPATHHVSESDSQDTVSDQGVMPHSPSAAKVVEEVAQSVKAAVQEAVAWAGEKATKLSEKDEDGVGPYASPATCAPTDLDAIASGVLPAMPSTSTSENEDSDKEAEGNGTSLKDEKDQREN
ncbi:hypothetical protein BS50DRAFT_78649 [Corynespora cassiicola Philippines]|uniref:Uncharacterized protein n=1 Tax=Corynespora cassiicola Philippines TaxID=1448308 RepID=A0A2T2NH96_CORCC|nr:hypothetical protein BS50DRAFT_78649 [Corynespora cassiicola Philippines]